MKYRKKPIVIDAMQWYKQGDHPAVSKYRGERWAAAVYGDAADGCEHCACHWADHGQIVTLEGDMIVCPGDWVITGVAGEVYPCRPRIFDATYELAE